MYGDCGGDLMLRWRNTRLQSQVMLLATLETGPTDTIPVQCMALTVEPRLPIPSLQVVSSPLFPFSRLIM